MTSFAFIAGLIPLVISHGAGAVGNKTIGSSAMGGMLLGTVFGVLVIPGLYYIFGKLADGRSLIKGEKDEPLSEEYVHTIQDQEQLLRQVHEKPQQTDDRQNSVNEKS
jgi:HAE1 family hydrophobic/amphiphilic exporter-1